MICFGYRGLPDIKFGDKNGEIIGSASLAISGGGWPAFHNLCKYPLHYRKAQKYANKYLTLTGPRVSSSIKAELLNSL